LLKILWQTNDYKSQTNKSIITQIETIFKYFTETKLKEQGLPTLSFLADNVHLSPSYLSDLLKETGKMLKNIFIL
jgi:AraC-like DNA-binding protein